MEMKRWVNRLHRCFVLTFLFGCLSVFRTEAQEHVFLSLDSIFSLAEQNSLQLKLSRQKMVISEDNTAIAKEVQLPKLEADASLGYISNAGILNSKWKYEESANMPHISNSYAVDGSMLVFSGGAIKNNIAKAKLEEKIAALDYEKDQENVQFLLTTQYLDLFTLYNQKKVYEQNLELANQRLHDIQSLAKQGMVTHNDVTRSQLQIADIQLKIKKITNDIRINSHDLDVVLGLPVTTLIDVDTTLYNKPLHQESIQHYLDLREGRIPELEVAEQEINIAQKDISIAKATKSPKLALYFESILNRPFTYSMPPMDIYLANFMGGAKLTYDISSLYTSKKKIHKAKTSYSIAQLRKEALSQQSDKEIHQAYVKLEEAKDEYETLQESFSLAKDNYRIVNQKYLNQLAVLTDMLDASTALLSSQLEVTNARVNVIYQWFKLKKCSGNWKQA